jgi:hypothetical protein
MDCQVSNSRRQILLAISLPILAVFLLTACNIQEIVVSTPTPTAEVDPRFREFYLRLGGLKVLGQPSSPLLDSAGVFSQYTDKVLMVFIPTAPQGLEYALAPLGNKLNLPTPSRVITQSENETVIDGFVIYSKFYPLYSTFRLTQYGGRPLSQPIVDVEQHRIVQYFENVGFYTDRDDPNDEVHLVDYGRMFCEEHCTNPLTPGSGSIASFSEPFLDGLTRLGFDLVGRPLETYSQAPDGNIEQLYENVIVYAQPGDIRHISLRALPSLVGIQSGPLAARQNDPQLVFIPIEGDLGYNVPTVFEEYILSHGGFEISGKPIEERHAFEDVYRQCFANYCLDFDPYSPGGVAPVRPAPLGRLYFDHNPSKTQAIPSIKIPAENIALKVWEKKPKISSQELQVINLMVRQIKNDAPVVGAIATLTVDIPDGGELVVNMPATDTDGITRLLLQPIHAENGRLVTYEICLTTVNKTSKCIEDAFIIWNLP